MGGRNPLSCPQSAQQEAEFDVQLALEVDTPVWAAYILTAIFPSKQNILSHLNFFFFFFERQSEGETESKQ